MHAFWQIVYCNFYPHFSIIKSFLSPGFFNNYHCLWFSQRSFTMISLDIPFLYLSCLMFSVFPESMFKCFSWVFWHYLLLMFQTLSLDHPLFSFKYLHYLKLFHSSWMLCLFFSPLFSYFAFQFGAVYWSIFRLLDSTLDCEQSRALPNKSILHFCDSVFDSFLNLS